MVWCSFFPFIVFQHATLIETCMLTGYLESFTVVYTSVITDLRTNMMKCIFPIRILRILHTRTRLHPRTDSLITCSNHINVDSLHLSLNLTIPCMEHHVLSIFKTTQYHRRETQMEFTWPKRIHYHSKFLKMRKVCEALMELSSPVWSGTFH